MMYAVKKARFAVCFAGVLAVCAAVGWAADGTTVGPPAKKIQQDVIKTKTDEFKITFLGHGTLMFVYQDKVVHVDPWSRLADYAGLPKADLVLLTHEHGDHLDPKALAAVRSERTEVVLPKACAEKVSGGIVMNNGDKKVIAGVEVEAIPAYNIRHKRPSGEPYHPKGRGNGYVVTFGKTRVYIAGDTENIPEMAKLKKIDVAFLPMNLPYTMTPQMVAEAAQAFKPKILYPYHYGKTDPKILADLLKGMKDIEVRIRNMQ